MYKTRIQSVARHGLARGFGFAAMGCLLMLAEPAWGAPAWGEPDYGRWVQGQNAVAKDWLLGFLSGLSVAWAAEGRTPARPMNALSSVDEPFTWMNHFCRANPREAIGRGAIILFFELARRQEGR